MTPRATYRLQFNRDFTLDDATALVPYLSALGISHVYASPIFAACSGSRHGYDVVDWNKINPEIGGFEALERLSRALKTHGMGLIIDIVPNHMAASHENAWWLDVLENGRKSRFAKFFDINWRPSEARLRNRLLLPVLGESLTDCLRKGEIRLAYDEAHQRLVLRYYDHLLPLSPGSYGSVLQQLGRPFSASNRDWTLPRAGDGPDLALSRHHLVQMWRDHPVRFENAIETFNAASTADPTAMLHLLAQQNYQLAPWIAAAARINWRRFFDIAGLVALRMDRAEVFNATHSLVLQLFRDGFIDGVRLDHVDGLADPQVYCRRLRRALKRVSDSHRDTRRDPFIVVEKILEPDETLPCGWQVDGATGYDFMTEVAGLLHDPSGEVELTRLWTELSGDHRSFSTVARDARREILQRLFPRQLEDLAIAFMALDRIRSTTAACEAMCRSLAALLSVFTRYRLYGDAKGLSVEDEAVLSACQRRATLLLAEADRPTLQTLCGYLRAGDRANTQIVEHRSRFQQLSATLAAKAVEDTAFYRYGRLLSRNEVGSDPGQFDVSVDSFHASCQRRHKLFPYSLLATATHDHKRGEDLRARLAVLSEDADNWSQLVHLWITRHEPRHPTVPAAVKLTLYQTVVSAWPLALEMHDSAGLALFEQRLAVWLQKSQREAKQQTSWERPDELYEANCRDFLSAILNAVDPAYFLAEVKAYVEHICGAGILNSLTQVTLRLTCPGIPDLYQGCELWDFSLVDPDNRQMVDFRSRQMALFRQTSLSDLLQSWRNGALKLHLIQSLLRLRAGCQPLFSRGRYLPLALSGPAVDRLIAFSRQHEDENLIVVLPRLTLPLLRPTVRPHIPASVWHGTCVHLPSTMTADALVDQLNMRPCNLKGNILPVDRLLEQFPLCVLHQKKTAVTESPAPHLN